MFYIDFQELIGLIQACNYTLEDNLIQNSSKIDFRYFIGSGKLVELKSLVEMTSSNIVIFNHELSGIQTKNLEKYLEVLVIDRTQLILNIFKDRVE